MTIASERGRATPGTADVRITPRISGPGEVAGTLAGRPEKWLAPSPGTLAGTPIDGSGSPPTVGATAMGAPIDDSGGGRTAYEYRATAPGIPGVTWPGGDTLAVMATAATGTSREPPATQRTA